MVEGKQCLLLLHQLPKHNERERAAIAFWRNENGAWRCFPGRDNIQTLKDHVEAVAKSLDELDDKLEAAEKATEFLALIKVARPMHRFTRNLHLALQQVRDAFPEDLEILALRDRAYELERLAETISDDTENGMQYTIAQHTEEQADLSERIAKESHRLNLVAAVALPITAIGSVLGMNLENGLEGLPEPLSFWCIVLGLVALGLFLNWRVQKT
jgi:Mg2+ and Co2+ transporter CorA